MQTCNRSAHAKRPGDVMETTQPASRQEADGTPERACYFGFFLDRQIFDGTDHFFIVAFDIYGRPGFGHDSIGVDKESRTTDSQGRFTVTNFFAPRTISVGNAMPNICQQREIQVELFSERLMACDIVRADSQNGRSQVRQFGAAVSECTRFYCAAGSIVFRIEIQDNRLTFKPRQVDNAAIGGREFKFRGCGAFFNPVCHV